MAEVSAMSDLELVLDRMSSEYPALVMETFLSIQIRLSVPYRVIVTQSVLSQEGTHHKGTVQLPLPPSGLPYSAKSVVAVEDLLVFWWYPEKESLVIFLRLPPLFITKLGFDDDLSNDNAFIEELSNLRDGSSQDDESLSLFVKAFTLFATKNILEACDVMKPLLSKSESDLTALVYTFLKYVIDQPVGSQPEKGLNKKRIVVPTKVLVSSLSDSRTGSSILTEMTERVAVAIALWQWECIREDRAEIMEQVIKRLEQICSVPYGCESTIYSALSIIHHLPTACIQTIRELMRRAVDKEAKQRLVQLCADLLLTFMNAVETHRRNVPVTATNELQWTTGTISDAYFLA
ncbi:hypothetical protein ANCCEY_14770, partial [Ancylostoma ceylanicum]